MGTGPKQVMVSSHQVCAACSIEKPVDAFHFRGRTQVVRQPKCKECNAANKRRCVNRWREQNPEQNRASRKATKVKLKYGLTPEDIEKLYVEQGGKCAICPKLLSFAKGPKSQRPHVDHDHESGKVRGLLCGQCNTGIGMFGDKPALLVAATAYLLRTVQGERLSEIAPAA
jgi:hypothetical protein